MRFASFSCFREYHYKWKSFLVIIWLTIFISFNSLLKGDYFACKAACCEMCSPDCVVFRSCTNIFLLFHVFLLFAYGDGEVGWKDLQAKRRFCVLFQNYIIYKQCRWKTEVNIFLSLWHSWCIYTIKYITKEKSESKYFFTSKDSHFEQFVYKIKIISCLDCFLNVCWLFFPYIT